MPHAASDERQHVDIDIAALERQMEESRAAQERALNSLIDELSAAVAADGDFDFAGLLRVGQQLLHLDDLEMSRILKVSRPTIGRWIRGISIPHILTKRAVLDALVKKARLQVKSIRA